MWMARVATASASTPPGNSFVVPLVKFTPNPSLRVRLCCHAHPSSKIELTPPSTQTNQSEKKPYWSSRCRCCKAWTGSTCISEGDDARMHVCKTLALFGILVFCLLGVVGGNGECTVVAEDISM